MKPIYEAFLASKKKNQKGLAILIDPDKIALENLDLLLLKIQKTPATHLFVGGSSVSNNIIDQIIIEAKKHLNIPILLFPGHPSQISKHADGILFLSLISGRNSDYLIDFQVQSVPILSQTNLEIIATSYILIDGGCTTAVERVSQTTPLSQDNPSYIAQTARAGEMMGSQCVYLEAGSGAIKSVSENIIKQVRQHISIPIIVGGGIKNQAQITATYQAGADLVVIGTAFENDNHFFENLFLF